MITNPKPLLIAQMAATIAAGMLADHENNNMATVVEDAVHTAAQIFDLVDREHGFIFEQ